MNPVIPYLRLKNAKEAIEFYKEVFNAKLNGEILYLKDVKGFEQYDNLIGHAEISINNSSFFICDKLNNELISGNQIHFIVECETLEVLNKRFNLIKQNGVVLQELQELFWCKQCGYLIDEFGIRWDLYYSKN